MKKLLFINLLIILLFPSVSCVKKKNNDAQNKESAVSESSSDNSQSDITNVTQYVSSYGVWAYANESDLGKKSGDVKEKMYLNFGSPVTIIGSKKENNIEYYKIQLPDDTTYWSPKENFAEKFIVINKTDVLCYTQPDTGYATQLKLQPGDFGIYVKEKNGFINADFYAYRPYKPGDEKKWVGNVWLKEGYTDNINAAREAYYLFLAYASLQKNKKDDAKTYLDKALEASETYGETDITPVVKDQLNELKTAN